MSNDMMEQALNDPDLDFREDDFPVYGFRLGLTDG